MDFPAMLFAEVMHMPIEDVPEYINDVQRITIMQQTALNKDLAELKQRFVEGGYNLEHLVKQSFFFGVASQRNSEVSQDVFEREFYQTLPNVVKFIKFMAFEEQMVNLMAFSWSIAYKVALEKTNEMPDIFADVIADIDMSNL